MNEETYTLTLIAVNERYLGLIILFFILIWKEGLEKCYYALIVV